jgi:hypothetical protein
MISMALYPIYIPDVIQPHYTLQRAFEDRFFPCWTYDWLAVSSKKGKKHAQTEFLNFLREKKPEYAFMQLQNPENMTVEMIREMARHTKIIQWSGDIRTTDAWYNWFEAIGKEIHLTLFSNMTDVHIMRHRGVRADYLQVGVDTGWYYPDAREKTGPKIVFSAHNYGSFELSDYRVQAALALREHFGNDFKLYGGGWQNHGFRATVSNCRQEAEAYRNAEIGISISNFNFKNYHSDRLLRIMACDCLAMSHDYDGHEQDYPNGEIVTFANIPELVEKCEYYLSHKDEAVKIRQKALSTIAESCTWDARVNQLIDLILKYE